MERKRGFEIAKGFEDQEIHMPIRKTKHAAGYDIEAAEDCTIPVFSPGQKPVSYTHLDVYKRQGQHQSNLLTVLLRLLPLC